MAQKGTKSRVVWVKNSSFVFEVKKDYVKRKESVGKKKCYLKIETQQGFWVFLIFKQIAVPVLRTLRKKMRKCSAKPLHQFLLYTF